MVIIAYNPYTTKNRETKEIYLIFHLPVTPDHVHKNTRNKEPILSSLLIPHTSFLIRREELSAKNFQKREYLFLIHFILIKKVFIFAENLQAGA